MSGLQEAYAKREDVTLHKHFHMLIGLALVRPSDIGKVFDDIVEYVDE